MMQASMQLLCCKASSYIIKDNDGCNHQSVCKAPTLRTRMHIITSSKPAGTATDQVPSAAA